MLMVEMEPTRRKAKNLNLKRPIVRTSTWIGLAALLFWGTAIPYAVWTQFGGDVRGLLRLGTNFRHPQALFGAPVYPGDGYDGQFFAALATDPFLLRDGAPLLFDAPVYRAARIGLPLVAWSLAAGNERFAVFLYQLLSWILGVLGIWVVARWLEDEGQSAWWASPLIVTGGLISSFMGSMPDPAALTLALIALRREQMRRSGVVALLVAAVMVRDVMMIPAVAIGAVALRERRFVRAAQVVGWPLIALLAWRAYVIYRFGFAGIDVPGGNFSIPLTWLPEKLAMSFDVPEILALAGAALAVMAGLLLLPGIARWTPLEATYAGFVLMALSLSRLNYLVTWWGYARALLPLAMLSVLVAVKLEPGWRRTWLHAVAVSWAAVGAVVLPRWAAGLGGVLLCIAAFDRLGGRRASPASE
jgi:hypothetical protein